MPKSRKKKRLPKRVLSLPDLERRRHLWCLRYRYSKPLSVLLAVVTRYLRELLPEFTCRLALGASRMRVLRQVLTESVLLALVGGVGGTLFAWWSVKIAVLWLGVGRDVKVGPDPAVLAFTLGVSIATGVLFGLVPGWKFSRLQLRPVNAAGVGWHIGRFSSTQALITMQLALSFCLLIGAGLLIRSFVALEDQDLASHAIIFWFPYSGGPYLLWSRSKTLSHSSPLGSLMAVLVLTAQGANAFT